MYKETEMIHIKKIIIKNQQKITKQKTHTTNKFSVLHLHVLLLLTDLAISNYSHFFTTSVTKTLVCAILSVGWYI